MEGEGQAADDAVGSVCACSMAHTLRLLRRGLMTRGPMSGSRSRCLASGSGAFARRPSCRSGAADRSAFLRRSLVGLLAAAGAALLAAARHRVHGRPRTSCGFLLGDTAILVSLLDVLGPAFLLIGVRTFVTTWHDQVLQTRLSIHGNSRPARAYPPRPSVEMVRARRGPSTGQTHRTRTGRLLPPSESGGRRGCSGSS